MAGLGQLVVSLVAETAQFRQAMDRAAYQSQKNFQTIAGAAKMATGVLAGFLAVRGFQNFVKEQLDAADALAKLSTRLNISVTELSRLQNAAQLAGVSSSELEQSLVRFSASVGKAAAGSDSLNSTFKSLGISVKDINGNIRPTEEILFDLADEFARTEDGARKLAIAQELGSRGFERLIPLLNQGREGLKKYSATFTDDFAVAAEQFNDSITALRQNFNRLAVTIGGPVLEAINKVFFDTFTKKGLETELEKVQLRIKNIADELQGIGSAGDISSQLRVNSLLAELEGLNARAGELARKREDLNKKTKDSIGLDEDDAKKKKTVSDLIADQVKQYQALILSKEELVLIDAALAGATEDQINQILRTSAAIREYKEQQEKLKDEQEKAVSLAQEWKTLYEATRSPVQALADAEAELLRKREEFIKAGYDQIAVDRAIAEARLNLTENTKETNKAAKDSVDISKEFGEVISSQFENAILQGNSFRKVLQGILRDIAAILVRQAITRPLANIISSSLPSVFGGGRALGGQVLAGQTYLVGEKGPEVFSPSVDGKIISNDKAMGSTNNVVVNVNMENGTTTASDASRLGSLIGNVVKAELIKQSRPGGLLAS